MASLLISAAINIAVGLLLSFLFAPEGQDVTQEGPKLEDLNVTSSAYGKNINLAFGTVRLNGNIIWSDGIEEVVTSTTQEQGGKGGGGGSVTQTTYSYFATFALALAEGQADKLLRIWADNKLIYDVTGTSSAASKFAVKFYDGRDDQAIDPIIAAHIDGLYGAGSTPAYNGICYLLADRWSLADFGNRIPNITAEITFEGQDTLPYQGLVELSGQDVPGSAAGGSAGYGMMLDPDTNFLYFVKNNNATSAGVADAFSMTTLNLVPGVSSLGDNSITVNFKDGIIYGQSGSGNFEALTAKNVFSDTDLGTSSFTFGNGIWPAVINAEFPGTPVPSATWLIVSRKSILDDGAFSWIRMDGPGTFTLVGSDTTPDGRGLNGGPAIANWFTQEAYVIMENNTNVEIYRFRVVPEFGLTGITTGIEQTKVVDATKASLGFAAAEIEGWILLPNENAIILGTGVPQSGSMVKFDLDDWSVITSTQANGTAAANNFATNGYWGTCRNTSTTSGGQYYIFDTDTLEIIRTYEASIAFPGETESAQRSCVWDPRFDAITFSRVYASSPSKPNRVVRVFLGRASGAGVPLENVVTSIADKAGLVAADIDVTDLIGDTVRGYVVSRNGSYRSALEPLQKAYLFDGVESDWKIKFVKRGGAAALTIAEDDIGRLGNEERIEEKRIQEVELPERVIIGYSDADRDYEPATAMDKRVANPNPTQFSRSELKIDFPLVFTPTEAKKLASSALFTTWGERLTLDSSLPWRYLRLDPTDIADMVFRGETRQIRMGEIEVGADLSLDFTAVQEDVSTYVSTVVGAAGEGFVPQVPFGGLPSKWIPMNLPLLLASEATIGTANRVYYAASGYEDSWPGVSIYQSIDLGNTYQQAAAFTVEAAWGVISTAPPDVWSANGTAWERLSGGAGAYTWDDVNTIDVKPLNEGARFATSTDTEVLNGANAAAIIKSDGTVEIIQFVTVTTVDAGTIRLSRLLRGRRGTEDYARGHVAGSTIVLLESGRIGSWRNPLTRINISDLYKPVTGATLLENTSQSTFIANGEDLRPYSVVNIASSRAGGDLTVTWERRTRFNGELLDGTGTAPLNEEEELYDIDYFLPGETTPFLSRTDLTSKTDTLTAAEFTALVPVGTDQLFFPNWNFERQVTNGTFPDGFDTVAANDGNWRVESGAVGSIAGPPGGGGSNYAVLTTDNTSSDFARFDSERKWSFIDDFFQTETFMDAAPTIDLDVWTSNPTVSDHGTQVDLRIYDKDDTLIQTISSGRIIGTPGTWINTIIASTAVVSGARTFDIRVTGDNNSGFSFDDCTGAVDQILINLNGIGVVIPAIEAKIYQKSAQVSQGKATRQRV